MKASALEYRFRLPLVFLLVVLAAWSFGARGTSLWMLIAVGMARRHWLNMQQASLAVGYAAALLAVAGALLRTWGAAYIGARVVAAPGIAAERLITAGPFRYTRNPLYVGTEVSFLALAILLPWYSAVFLLVAALVFFLRLALAEEARLAEVAGYGEYAARVPRFVPALRPRTGAGVSAPRPRWTQAVLGEIYYWGAAVSFAAWAPQFNVLRIWQGVALSFGVSLIVKALWPRSHSSMRA